MPKRKKHRRATMEVECRCLTRIVSDPPCHGLMRNCSPRGFYIELDVGYPAGAILMVRASNRLAQADCIRRFRPHRTLFLGEVKWVQPLKRKGLFLKYGLGLKYFQPDIPP